MERTKRLVGVALLGALLALQGACYHSVVEREPMAGPPDFHQAWRPAFIAGLVPANVDASEACAGQWAKVETQHSFLNWVVGAVTLGIFTPMDVRIWCSE